MAYIELEELLKDINDLKKSSWYNDDYGFGTRQARHDGVAVVVDLCIKQALIADAVKVVRCKDCVYGEADYGINGDIITPFQYHCEYEDTWNRPDHYCAYGKKKEDDTE